jgi:hypothetical protein
MLSLQGPGHAFACLKREGEMCDELIEKLMGQHHSGFRVQAVNRMAGADRDRQMALAQYRREFLLREEDALDRRIREGDIILTWPGLRVKTLCSLPEDGI